MNWPKISVVVPCFNHADFIEQTLCSVLDQKYPNLELLVIDGGSTDGSVELIKKHKHHISYWVSEPDRGQTHALVKGFSKATGDIQCWLNSDDMHGKNTLFEVAAYFQAHPDVDAVYGDTIWIARDGGVIGVQREIPFNRFIWLYTRNYVPGMSMFWRRELYERAGGLNPEFNLSMDADLWIRFADAGKIKHVRRIWSRMRYYPEQKNLRLREKSDAEDLKIRRRYWEADYPSFFWARRTSAHSLRVVWKLLTGCYTFQYKRLR